MRLGPAFLGCRLLTRSHHREGRLPFRLLFLLAHLDRHGDGPDVAEGILELAVPLSPEPVLQWEGWLRAGGQGLVPRIGGARRRRPGCPFRFRSRRRSLCSSSHWKTRRGAKRIRRLRMTHGGPERASRPSQRPMRTPSTYAPRIRTWPRPTPSSTKPRESYHRRAR